MSKRPCFERSKWVLESERQGVHWLVIPGWEGYQVSDRGLLKAGSALETIDVVKLEGDHVQPISVRRVRKASAYLSFDVYDGNGRRVALLLHRARLAAFRGGPLDGKNSVRHLDGDPTNNDLDNLAWGTHLEQMADVKQHGVLKGARNPAARIREHEAVAIYILARLGFLSKANCKSLTGLSYSQVHKISTGRGWSHLISENIMHWTQRAQEIQQSQELAREAEHREATKRAVQQALREQRAWWRRQVEELMRKAADGEQNGEL